MQTEMAHIDLHLFSFRLLAGVNTTLAFWFPKLLSDFKEAFFNLSFYTRLELLLHVVEFEVLSFEILEWMPFLLLLVTVLTHSSQFFKCLDWLSKASLINYFLFFGGVLSVLTAFCTLSILNVMLCIRDRVSRFLLASRLLLWYPTRWADFAVVFASRWAIRLSTWIKFISVRLFFDRSVLNLAHLLAIGWRLSLSLLHSVALLNTLIHCLDTATTFMSLLIRGVGFHTSVTYSTLKILHLLTLFLSLGLLVTLKLRMSFTAIRMHRRTILLILLLALSTSYSIHIWALRSSIVLGFMLALFSCFVISVRLLALPMFNYLNLSACCWAHFTLPLLALVVVSRVIILW